MSAAILVPLRTEHIQGTDRWIVTDWFRFHSDVLHRTISVPPGVTTDFNSTPRVLWRIMPRDENPEAGTLHDRLYQRNGFPRAICDRLHREVLEVLDRDKPGCAPAWKRWAMYVGLRLGGWRAWNRYRKADKACGRSC